jgi:TolB-like protein/DNA-binding winged helix-turn-helix (wHTH) protein/Tfp pilus assembly protein PilF
VQLPGQFRGVVRFGAFQVDLSSGELEKHGIKIRLQDQPFHILVMLLERPGEVVTREELRQKLWPVDTFVDFDKGLNSAVLRLRSALADSAENPHYIETLPRRGYRFVAAVDGAVPAASSAVASTPLVAETPVVGTGKPSAEGSVQPATGLIARRIWIAALAVAAIAALLLGVNVGGWRGRLLGKGGPVSVQSIAVLPLENLTGDPSQEYFADGMTDAIITDLAQIGSLKVISRTSAMQYKGVRKLPLPEIARQLNVDAVVEGAVARSSNRVRITAQLIQAQTDRHLWAGSYERDLRDVLALQGEVAQAIAGEIRIKLTPQEQVRLAGRPVNPEAYEAYLQGRYYYWNKFTREGFEQAIRYFQKAVEKDSNYAPAYAGLSDSYRFLAWAGPLPPGESMPKAEAAARKALELDNSLAEAHVAFGGVLYRFHWDWSRSEAEFKRALALSPSSAEAHREYSVFLRTSGRFDKAIDEAKRAKELDPLSLEMSVDFGAAFCMAGRYDEALKESRKILEMDPNHVGAHWWLGLAYEGKGDPPKAIAALEKAASLSGRNPAQLGFLGNAYAVFGQKNQAEKILAELKGRSKREYIPPYHMALIHAGLGEKEQALAWLEKAYEDRSFSLVTIGSWKQFDGLHRDSHFQDLLRRISFPIQKTAPQSSSEQSSPKTPK